MKRSVFSIPVIFLFLILSGNKIYGNSEESKQLSREEISENIENKNELIEKLIKKNEQSIWGISLKTQQLLEQGKQVIKPWEHSWQLGINYFHTYNHGNSRPAYERFFTRDKNIFNRNLHPNGPGNKKDFKEKKPEYDDSDLRWILETSYGFIDTEVQDEPLVDLELFPSLKPKEVGERELPTKSEIAYIKPQSPKIPEIPEVPVSDPGYKCQVFIPSFTFKLYPNDSKNTAYISTDGHSFYKGPWGDSVEKPTAMFSQQDMESTDPSKKGKFISNIEADGDNTKQTLISENITFSSIYKKNNEKELTTTEPFSVTMTSPNGLSPLKFTGPHFFTIKNSELVFTTKFQEDDTQEIDAYTNATLVSDKDGDTSLTLDKDSSITLNGNGNIGIETNQCNSDFIPAFINKGTNKTNGILNHFILANNSPVAIENRGDVTVLGTRRNSYATFYNSKGFSFVNKKNITVDGEKNTAIAIIKDGFGEIILESPIEVKGNLNTGITFAECDTADLYATGKSAPRGAVSSTDSDIKNTAKILIGDENGKYRNSLLNIKVDGNNNIGIGKHDNGKNIIIDNFNIVGNGNDNIMIYFNKTTHSTIGKKLPGTIMISGGKNNTGMVIEDKDLIYNTKDKTHISDFSTEVVGDKAYIKIENSPGAQGILTLGGEELLNGHITVNSPSSKGIYARNSWIKHGGTLDFNGWTENGIGATGINILTSKFENSGEVDIKVSGEGSSGIFLYHIGNQRSSGTFENVTISAEDNAIALVNIDSFLTFKENNTINVGKNAQGIHMNGPTQFIDKVVMNVNGDPVTGERGLGMNLLLPPTSTMPDFATTFSKTVKNMTRQTFKKLEINLDGGIGFRIENTKINLSETTPKGIADLGGPTINIINDNSITFAFRGGKLTVDQDVNLDNPGDAFNQIIFADTPIINNSNVKGTKDNQYFAFIVNNTQAPAARFIENHGTIDLSGKNGVALYSDKGNILNDGKISVGENSIAMEILNDNNNNLGDSTVRELSIVNSATGDISVGKKGVGIYYTEDSVDDTQHIKADIENKGKIHSNSSDVTGMFITIDNSPKKHPDPDKKIQINTFKNTGTIELTGDNSVGIFVKNNIGKLKIENTGEIIVGNSKADNSSAGIFSQNENSKITNSGKITAGDSAYGIIGYEIKTTPNSEIKVGKNGVGIYSGGKDVNLKGKLEVAGDKGIGLYSSGNNQTITADLDQMVISKGSVGFYTNGYGNNLEANCALPVDLKGDSAFILSKFGSGDVTNNVNLTASGDFNHGIYGGGNIKNKGNMDFANGIGNIGAFAIANGTILNSGKIRIGGSDPDKEIYSIGMAGGYYDHKNKKDKEHGTVVNEAGGIIEVVGDKSIGMYASGRDSKAINHGTIKLMGKDSVGMFIENNAVGENRGTITATADAIGAIGAFVMRGGVFKNYGTISIEKAKGTKGVFAANKESFKNYNEEPGSIKAEKPVSNLGDFPMDKELPNVSIKKNSGEEIPEITINDIKQPIISVNIDKPTPEPDFINVSSDKEEINKINIPNSPFEKIPSNAMITKLGMYVDTSGINFTNPITGIENIDKLVDVDFIIGTEATRYTNSKAIEIKKNIIEPYNEVLKDKDNINKLSVYAGSLTWLGTGKLGDGQAMGSLYLAKIPYTDFANPSANLYNFTDGLEKRYGVEDIYSREKQVFNKLNDIGENEQVLLTQAFKEMMGYEYSNTYRRIWDGKRTFDREFDTLMKWDTETKDTTKVKFFREDNKFRTTRDGVTSYNRTSDGVFVLNNNETVTLGDSWGWFFGASIDTYKFKDLGGSKEKSYNGEIGYYKSKAFGHNEEIEYLIKGGVEASHRKMDRRYVVVDEIFKAKSRYHSVGGFIDTDFSTNFRLSQGFTLTPSAGVDLSATRIRRIKEKSGEVRLRVKGRTELAATPHANLTLAHSTDRTKDSRIKTELSYGIYRKYARDQKLKAKVNYTDADYYSLEKDKYRTNSEVSLGVALEKPSYGVGGKVIRNLNHNYTSYQLDFRVKF